jgi:hypothetical protein
VLVVAAAGLAAWRSPSGLVLIVEDAGRGRLLHRERVTAGERVVLSYVHSSERVPVRGLFRVEADRTLTLTETHFAGFGPGLPALARGEAWRLEGGMIVAEAHQRLPALRMRVVPLTRHRLATPAGQDLDLSALMGRGGVVRIYVCAGWLACRLGG